MPPLKNVCRRASSSLVRVFDAFLNPVHPRSISSHMGFEVNTWLWFQLQPIAGLEGVLESSRDTGHALAPALLWCFVPDRCEHRRKPRISSRMFPGCFHEARQLQNLRAHRTPKTWRGGRGRPQQICKIKPKTVFILFNFLKLKDFHRGFVLESPKYWAK